VTKLTTISFNFEDKAAVYSWRVEYYVYLILGLEYLVVGHGAILLF
jgi:hypothetical protein